MIESTKILNWMQDNQAAANLIEQLFEVSQIADDLVDWDKEFDSSVCVSQLLNLCLVEIPLNQFYNKNCICISSVLVPVIAAFNTSNKLKKHPDADCRMFAWALRDALEHVVILCAFLIGGHEHSLKVSLEVTQYFRTNEDRESVDEWCKS